MKKIAWRITSNLKEGAEHKEYDKTMYRCEPDETWVETEIPVAK